MTYLLLALAAAGNGVRALTIIVLLSIALPGVPASAEKLQLKSTQTSDTRPLSGLENQIDLFLRHYPVIVSRTLTQNQKSRAAAALPHPSEMDRFMKRWRDADAYLTQNGIKRAEWIKLCNRIFKLWVWYYQESQLQTEIQSIDATMNDTKPGLSMNGPEGLLHIRQIQLKMQLKQLQISRGRPKPAELELMRSNETQIWPVLKDAEEQVEIFNNDR